ncbi:hypothetical protein WA158_000922 [Blastocystis sp. Blastoise]
MQRLNKLIKPELLKSLNQSQLRTLSSTNFPSYITEAPLTEVSTLSNGIRIATEAGFGRSSSVALGIDVGSRFENPASNGVAHYLEHLSFKGTQRRSKNQLEKIIEDKGSVLNAYTSRDMTAYYLQCFKDDVPFAVDFISDLIFHSKYPLEAVEEERHVIISEYNYIFENKYEFLFDLLHSVAFPANGLGLPTLGPLDNIKKITRDDIVRFVHSYYTGSRLVLAGAGGIQHDELVELGEKYLKDVAATPEPAFIPPPAKFMPGYTKYMDEEYPIANEVIVFESCGWNNPDSFTFMILYAMLGQYDSTSLMTETNTPLTREIARQKLCTSLSTVNIAYRETGLFGAYFECLPETIDSATECVMNSFKSLKENITEEDVETAKQRFIFSSFVSMDTSMKKVEDICRQLIVYGRRLTPAEIIARVNFITVDSVRDLIDRYILNKPVAVAAYGPVQKLQNKEWFDNFYKH